jgi:hypothetical protein
VDLTAGVPLDGLASVGYLPLLAAPPTQAAQAMEMHATHPMRWRRKRTVRTFVTAWARTLRHPAEAARYEAGSPAPCLAAPGTYQ